MKTKSSRFIFLLGCIIIAIGYGLNVAARKYQSLYRSLQYRNLKLEETLLTQSNQSLLMGVIGFMALGALILFIVKRHKELKSKALPLFGIIMFSGQALSVLSGNSAESMGLYVVFLGYTVIFIGCLIGLHERG